MKKFITMMVVLVWGCATAPNDSQEATESLRVNSSTHPVDVVDDEDLESETETESLVFDEDEVEPVVWRTTPTVTIDATAKRGQQGPKAVRKANKRATRSPQDSAYVEATQVYDFVPGVIYQVYASPGRVTSLLLEPGEIVEGIAAGDTVRWMLNEGKTGARTVLWLKPLREQVSTNLVITTNRRMYQLELKSFAETYMASVVWSYPMEMAIARTPAAKGNEASSVNMTAVVFDATRHNAAYHFVVDDVRRVPVWKPTYVFDDGWRTYFEFDAKVLERATPVIWVLARDGTPELVNARRVGAMLVVDRIGQVFELKLGEEASERIYVERYTGE